MSTCAKRVFAVLMGGLLMPLTVAGQIGRSQLDALQTEMYRLFYTEDSVKFRQTVTDLMAAAQQAGDMEVFYKAWGNKSIYESTHKRRTKALDIAREMEDDAKSRDNVFGRYSAIHVMGSIYHQMRDYEMAEETFNRAINFLHANDATKSAAADYIELVLISVNDRRDVLKGMEYAEKALKEPHVSAAHRLRVLTMLCQMEGEKPNPDRDLFNRYYEERRQVLKGTPPDRADRAVRLLHFYVNGDYESAMLLTDSLSTPDQTIYQKARIYHRMGDDAKAYEQMLLHKSVSDSLQRAERSGLLSEYIVQLNNERLELEKEELQRQNTILFAIIVLFLGALLVIVLVWIIRRRVKLTRKLMAHNEELGKARDVEREARMEEHQKRREVQRELDVKREFLNNIAKELRSPLNPITGFSSLLADNTVELQPEERELMSAHIAESTKALTGIIDNMIELSYYESKARLDKTEKFSPRLVCQNAVDYVMVYYKKPGVEVAYRSEVPDNFLMKSDMQAVVKVLRHLLDNAMKFTDQGSVTLNCQLTDEGMVRFVVTDTGCGIEPEWRKHIFEPMVKTSSSMKSTGMGLAICRVITQLLEGKLWLDEEYNKGSRFIFEIPKL